ncbi:aldo/keto reductase [Actinoplanes friuliensis]|jgi:2,5-diketo-D-gluconate reductase A|uniref:2,5-didehydrogluconate reductase n=1 Tax=Actinoplanes friuliensis DSM 7358 TaxID=1246995 RepID=U5WAE6_9ACTN|nr:aldo/keto reductase [Actinoplanes friuliensis]AGZ45997.1 2,5-didehydrogluconate reductase [Actinoplanes friuliensis DSM 7358]
MSSAVPDITLNDGRTIPQLGFGVFQVPPAETQKAVETAIEIGYRHIDTAQMYGNEAGVGAAVAASGLNRDEFFLTSKLNNGFHLPDDARRSFDETLKALGTDHIDLFLIHWPLPGRYNGDFVQTWNTLEEFYRDGRARSIGVSNFTQHHLGRLRAETQVRPAVNQIEVHPYLTNDDLRTYNTENEIANEAYSPIAQGEVLGDPVIVDIARQAGKSPAQVVLRWHIQRGDIIFPKSKTADRVRENFEIFDFELDGSAMASITSLDRGEKGRTGANPDTMNWIPEN